MVATQHRLQLEEHGFGKQQGLPDYRNFLAVALTFSRRIGLSLDEVPRKDVGIETRRFRRLAGSKSAATIARLLFNIPKPPLGRIDGELVTQALHDG